jgi:UDP-N-acetylglucosamine acyltransferase
MMIHRTAIVHPEAQLEIDVRVGAYSSIGPGVAIGRGTVIESHVVIDCNTRVGEACHIFPHAIIGTDPQDLSYKGEPSFVEVGDRTVVREFVTVNRGAHDQRITRVGSDCLLMTGVHIAHDCQVGDKVIMANLVTLGGHLVVEDGAVIGGLAAFHQFVRVGRQAMVGGTAGVMQDVPPYCMAQGAPPATVRGLNVVGLKRAGISDDRMAALKQAFRLMFRRGMTKENALAEIQASVPKTPEVQNFVAFISADSRRGICRGHPSGASLSVMAGEEGKQREDRDSREGGTAT